MADFKLPADYIEVKDRIVAWYAEHPDGRIVADAPTVVDVAGAVFIASTVRVYRSADDPMPCQGSAFEPYPGKTPYTKDSEAMNAETSAVGRALALAGIEVKRSIASRDDVQYRQQPAPTFAAGADRAALRERVTALDLKAGELAALQAWRRDNDLPALTNAEMTVQQFAVWVEYVDGLEHAEVSDA